MRVHVIVVAAAGLCSLRSVHAQAPPLQNLASVLSGMMSSEEGSNSNIKNIEKDGNGIGRSDKRWLGVKGDWEGLQPWMNHADQHTADGRLQRTKGMSP